MNIPTYKANVGQYNVPSMNASGEFNNAEMIYEGVAKLSDSITKTAINMYENEKAYAKSQWSTWAAYIN